MTLAIRWAMRLLALAALCLSVYLSSLTLGTDAIAGCDGSDAGCDEVLQSPWSQWLGVPVSVFGAAVYGGILLGAAGGEPDQLNAILAGGTRAEYTDSGRAGTMLPFDRLSQPCSKH